MLPQPALIQVDLDYRQADVDKKIQQYISVSQQPSAELDKAFIIDIALGLVCPFACLFKSHKTFISIFRCDKCALIKRIVGYIRKTTHS